MRSATKKKTGKSAAYLAWIHGHPCIVETCRRLPVEAAHIGPRGLSTKVPDWQALPLCHRHHEQLHALGPKRFWELHALDPEALIALFNAQFEAAA
jgi:hypothetical protein